MRAQGLQFISTVLEREPQLSFDVLDPGTHVQLTQQHTQNVVGWDHRQYIRANMHVPKQIPDGGGQEGDKNTNLVSGE